MKSTFIPQKSIQKSVHCDAEIVYGLDAIVERTLKRLSKANTKTDDFTVVVSFVISFDIAAVIDKDFY